MFEGFTEHHIDTGHGSVFVRMKGEGAPLLLLHGFPETHAMWHRIAPRLAESFTVVCADLPGYGNSGGPPVAEDHVPHSKRAFGNSLVTAMSRLGFSRFMVAGHDRGGRVAYRMALDHGDKVTKLAVLDVIPTGVVLDRADARLATSFWPWSLLCQPSPLPERLLIADPEAVVEDAISAWGSPAAAFPAEVKAAYVDALRSLDSATAICEEYRASIAVDADMDCEDLRAGRRIACPVLVLWSDGAVNDWYSTDGGPLGVWSQWALDVRGQYVPGGHFFPEANPDHTGRLLHEFFAMTRSA
jgi:haloacetate dehalogenase